MPISCPVCAAQPGPRCTSRRHMRIGSEGVNMSMRVSADRAGRAMRYTGGRRSGRVRGRAGQRLCRRAMAFLGVTVLMSSPQGAGRKALSGCEWLLFMHVDDLEACEDVEHFKLIGGAAGLAGSARFMLSSTCCQRWLTMLVI